MAVRVCGESPELSEPQATAQRGVVSLLVPVWDRNMAVVGVTLLES